ncbi:U3 small nucleolar RNA-associated protein 6 homolog [Eurosta solidaginis]|uniref:U3 small nucleolar RNA-associated protein 6 homolog n=1 Tax=Eurosta solidaginis TaxID=178769 RepID=UPI0035307487
MEVVQELQERALPVYEQLKKYEICDDNEISDYKQKRESFGLQLTQKSVNSRTYVEYIILERKMFRLVERKEVENKIELRGLKNNLINHITKLYRECLKKFPEAEGLWNHFIEFSKHSNPMQVLGIYEKMLTFHGSNAKHWVEAALWAFSIDSESLVWQEICTRGLQRHPNEEILSKTLFDLLIFVASKRLQAGKKLDYESALRQAECVYKNCCTAINSLPFFIGLVERCEDASFINITASLQLKIIEDLMDRYPSQEKLWDFLAQREFKGYSLNDLKDQAKKKDISSNDQLDEHINKSVFKKRTMRQRIEQCSKVYETALKTLKTRTMCQYYINAMLIVNENNGADLPTRRKHLAMALKMGHESGLMSEEHYCVFLRLLILTESGRKIAETMLSEICSAYKSVKLYEVWISYYISLNASDMIEKIQAKAVKDLGDKSGPIFELAIKYFKTRYDEDRSTLDRLYREAIKFNSPKFDVFRAQYLDFCMINSPFDKVRKEYDYLSQLPPPCLKLHEKMAELESQIILQTKQDTERRRQVYENMVLQFGKENTSVWMQYVRFECLYGDRNRVTHIYNRAKSTLKENLVYPFQMEFDLKKEHFKDEAD